jgi:hypothetical protein
LIKRLVWMIFFLLVGLSGKGWALTPEVPLQVEGDRLTAHLSQVPLRTVLEQLQKQLGITYEVPAGELDNLISVDLQQTPILPALAKILAPWDYAFTVNAGGHLRSLYITPKAPPTDVVSERSEPSNVRPSNALADTGSSSLTGSDSDTGGEVRDANPSLSYEREADPILPHSSTPFASPEELDGLRSPVAGGPMAIQPVPEGTTMPMMPAGGGSGMQVTPAGSAPNMPIIPATAYPPMDIQPVPDYLQEEMLRMIQP